MQDSKHLYVFPPWGERIGSAMWSRQVFIIVAALAAAFTPIVNSEVVASMNGVSSYIRAEIPHNTANNPFAAVVWFWPPTSNAASSGTSKANGSERQKGKI